MGNLVHCSIVGVNDTFVQLARRVVQSRSGVGVAVADIVFPKDIVMGLNRQVLPNP